MQTEIDQNNRKKFGYRGNTPPPSAPQKKSKPELELEIRKKIESLDSAGLMAYLDEIGYLSTLQKSNPGFRNLYEYAIEEESGVRWFTQLIFNEDKEKKSSNRWFAVNEIFDVLKKEKLI